MFFEKLFKRKFSSTANRYKNVPELSNVIYLRTKQNRKYLIDASSILPLLKVYSNSDNKVTLHESIEMELEKAYRFELNDDVDVLDYINRHNLNVLNLLYRDRPEMFNLIGEIDLTDINVNRVILCNNHFIDIDLYVIKHCIPKLTKILTDELNYEVNYVDNGLIVYNYSSYTFDFSAIARQLNKEYGLTVSLDIRDYEPYSLMFSQYNWRDDLRNFDVCMYKMEWNTLLHNEDEIILYEGANCTIREMDDYKLCSKR